MVELARDPYKDASEQQPYLDFIHETVDALLDEFDRGDFDVDTYTEKLREAISNYPVFILLEKIEDRGGTLFARFKDSITAYGKTKLIPYVNSLIGTEARVEDYLTDLHWFFLGLLYVKDPATAEHCMDTFAVAFRLSASPVEALYEFSGEIRKQLLASAAVHDVGKTNVPNIISHNPFSTDEQRALFILDMVDPKRPPHTNFVQPFLDPEDSGKFSPLIEGDLRQREPFAAEQMAHDLAQALQQKGGPRVFRNVLPLRLIASVAHHVNGHQTMPDGVMKHLPPGKQVLCLTGEVRRAIAEQAVPLSHFDAIMTLFDKHGWKQSFMDGLMDHEVAGARLFAQRTEGSERDEKGAFISMVGGHHAYPMTRRDLEGEYPWLTQHFVDLNVAHVRHVLSLADVIAALSQEARVYKRGASTLGKIGTILDDEVKDGKFPASLVRNVKKTLLDGDAQTKGIRAILDLMARQSRRVIAAAG